MKLSNMQVMNPQFVPALDKLMKKSIPVSVCVELADCISEIEKKINTIQKVKNAIIDKYLEKDAKGKVILIDGKSPKYTSVDAQQKFISEVNDLLKENFEVTFNSKIDLDETDLMSAQEYVLIKDFVNIVKKSIDATKK
jgi:hypothetical protein